MYFGMGPNRETITLGLLAILAVVIIWVGFTGRPGDVLAAVFSPGDLQPVQG